MKNWYLYFILKISRNLLTFGSLLCKVWKMYSLSTSETAGFWSCFKHQSQHLLTSQCHLQCEIALLACAKLMLQARRLWPELKQQNISGEHGHTHIALSLCGDVHHGPMFTGLTVGLQEWFSGC